MSYRLTSMRLAAQDAARKSWSVRRAYRIALRLFWGRRFVGKVPRGRHRGNDRPNIGPGSRCNGSLTGRRKRALGRFAHCACAALDLVDARLHLGAVYPLKNHPELAEAVLHQRRRLGPLHLAERRLDSGLETIRVHPLRQRCRRAALALVPQRLCRLQPFHDQLGLLAPRLGIGGAHDRKGLRTGEDEQDQGEPRGRAAYPAIAWRPGKG